MQLLVQLSWLGNPIGARMRHGTTGIRKRSGVQCTVCLALVSALASRDGGSPREHWGVRERSGGASTDAGRVQSRRGGWVGLASGRFISIVALKRQLMRGTELRRPVRRKIGVLTAARVEQAGCHKLVSAAGSQNCRSHCEAPSAVTASQCQWLLRAQN